MHRFIGFLPSTHRIPRSAAKKSRARKCRHRLLVDRQGGPGPRQQPGSSRPGRPRSGENAASVSGSADPLAATGRERIVEVRQTEREVAWFKAVDPAGGAGLGGIGQSEQGQRGGRHVAVVTQCRTGKPAGGAAACRESLDTPSSEFAEPRVVPGAQHPDRADEQQGIRELPESAAASASHNRMGP